MKPAPLVIENLSPAGAPQRILRLQGPLVLATSSHFQKVFQQESPPTTYLDLSSVPYLDSAGLGCLVNAHISSYKAGRKLALVAPSDYVMRVIQQAHAHRLFDLFPSLDEARRGLAAD